MEITFDEALGSLHVATKRHIQLGGEIKPKGLFGLTPSWYMQFSPHPRYTYVNGEWKTCMQLSDDCLQLV